MHNMEHYLPMALSWHFLSFSFDTGLNYFFELDREGNVSRIASLVSILLALCLIFVICFPLVSVFNRYISLRNRLFDDDCVIRYLDECMGPLSSNPRRD